jgi:hypothetical protein
MRYAIATGRAMYDPTPALRGVLTPNKKKSFCQYHRTQRHCPDSSYHVRLQGITDHSRIADNRTLRVCAYW